jgi:hypothetical protein
VVDGERAVILGQFGEETKTGGPLWICQRDNEYWLRALHQLFDLTEAFSQDRQHERGRACFRLGMGCIGPVSAQYYSCFSFFLFLLGLENF